MKILKSWKKFNENVTKSFDSLDPINYNSGAYSFHLNFNINDITHKNPFVYPGGEFTTGREGKALLEQFVQAIQKHDLSEVKEFRNGKKTFFDEEKSVVSCGSNNLDMREIPKEVWEYKIFTTASEQEKTGLTNYLPPNGIKICKPVKELEEGKIYTSFDFTDSDAPIGTSGHFPSYTGIIDVTEEVKKFIEMNK